MVTHHRAPVEQLYDIPFQFYKVVQHFNSGTRFSDTQFTLKRVTNKNGLCLMLPFHVLYDFPPTLLEEPLTRPDAMKQPFLNLITTMKRCSSVYCPPMKEDEKGSSEEEVMLN